MRLPSGKQIMEARRAEVTEIISDLPAISITSGSKVTISSIALSSPSHNSVNISAPEYGYHRSLSKVVVSLITTSLKLHNGIGSYITLTPIYYIQAQVQYSPQPGDNPAYRR